MVLPVLDGLDEMPDAARGSAMQRLNQQLAPKDGLILTCRVQEYADAVDKGDALRWAGVLPAQPVSATTAGSYLQSSSVAHGKRWQMVVDHLHASDSPLAQALSTPLMIWLARTAYAASASSPREMVSGSFSDRTAIEDHLLDSLVPAVFDDGSISGPKGGSWSARRASRYLSFLARHLTQTDRRDLAWRDLWATTQANTLVGILAILLYMYLCAGYFLSHAAAMRLFAPTIPTACAVTIGILGSIRSRPEASRPPRGHAGRGLMAVRLARPTLMGVGIVGVLLPLRGLPGPLLADAAITTVAAVGALAIIRTSLAWRTDVDSADPLQELRGERAVFLSMATALVVELGLAGPLLITPTAGFASRGTLIAYGAAEGLVTAFATGCGWPRWCQRT
jgi:hypothetical protein